MSKISTVSTFRSAPSTFVQAQPASDNGDNFFYKEVLQPAAHQLESFRTTVENTKGPFGEILRFFYPVQSPEMRFISNHGLGGLGTISDAGLAFSIVHNGALEPELAKGQTGLGHQISGFVPTFSDAPYQRAWETVQQQDHADPQVGLAVEYLKESEATHFEQAGTSVAKVSQTIGNFGASNFLQTFGGFIAAPNIGSRLIGTVSADLDKGNMLLARIKTFISFVLFGISSVLIGQNVVSSSSASLIKNPWVSSLLTLNAIPLILSHVVEPVLKAFAGLIDPAGTLGKSEPTGFLSKLLNGASNLFSWVRASSLIAFSANHHAHMNEAMETMRASDINSGEYKSARFSMHFNRTAKWAQASAIITMVIGQIFSSVIQNRYKNFEKEFKPLQEAIEGLYQEKLEEIRQLYQAQKITREQAEKLLQELQAKVQAIYTNKLQPLQEQKLKPLQTMQWVAGLFNEYTNVAIMGSMFLNGFVQVSQRALHSHPELSYRAALGKHLGTLNTWDRIQPFVGVGGLALQLATGVPLAIFSNGSPLEGKLGGFGKMLENLDKNPNFQLLKDLSWAA